jgi:hypothetical protein
MDFLAPWNDSVRMMSDATALLGDRIVHLLER